MAVDAEAVGGLRFWPLIAPDRDEQVDRPVDEFLGRVFVAVEGVVVVHAVTFSIRCRVRHC